MRFGVPRFPAFALLASVVATASEAATGPVEMIDRIAKRLDLQTEMPADPDPAQRIHFSDTHWHIPGDVAEWILFGAIAVALAFALWALRDAIPGLSRRPRDKTHAAAPVVLTPDPILERLAEVGDDADALAQRGLFAEAMHVLLLRGLAELRRRLDVTVADSLTSREILVRLPLPDSARRAFADLIGRVERVHFGRREAGAADYAAARANFDGMVGALGPTGSAA